MRIGIFILINLLVMGTTLLADEQLPVLVVSGQTFHNVTITSVSATDIFFTSDQGMGNAKLKDLDPALQKHFHYNGAQAGASGQKPRAASAGFHFRVADASASAPVSGADLKLELADAITRVKVIVNQPVTPIAAAPGMYVSTYSPGWFHAGAIRPDFNNVDVRKTQDLSYAAKQYVTSDLNPGVVFPGAELEFNSMTKYFYTDRSVPKKKLTEQEMVEINRLYRIIGQDEAQMSR